eukprot:ctg_302.g126
MPSRPRTSRCCGFASTGDGVGVRHPPSAVGARVDAAAGGRARRAQSDGLLRGDVVGRIGGGGPVSARLHSAQCAGALPGALCGGAGAGPLGRARDRVCGLGGAAHVLPATLPGGAGDGIRGGRGRIRHSGRFGGRSVVAVLSASPGRL